MWFFPGFFFTLLGPFFFTFVAIRIGSAIFRNIQRSDRQVEFPNPVTRYRLPETASPAGRDRMQARVFKLAYRLKGRVTVSDVVVETGMPVQEAEELLEGMVDGIHVRMEIRDNGGILYEFPEIIDRFESQ